MHIGIVGLPNSSKTTIFNALTGGQAETASFGAARFDVQHAMVDVPDPRLQQLAAIFEPKKVTPARVEYHDIAGLGKGMSEKGLSGEVLGAISQNDALLHVVRAFEDEDVPHPEGSVDPARDVALFDAELLLSDLLIVDKRLDRLRESMRKPLPREEKAQQEAELAVLERLHEALEAERFVREVELTPDEEKMIRGFQLLTAKPMFIVFNTGDDEVGDPTSILRYEHPRSELATIRGRLEMEVAQLAPEERQEFMEAYEIEEPGLDRVIRQSYALLGLHSFFTAGETEVRAWTLPLGASALDAAAAIHTDLARGFIRAEVSAFDDLIEAGGFAGAKKAGTLRLEGKDYMVADGDVITIRFNV